LGLGSFGVKLAEALVPIALGGISFGIVAKLLRVKELEQAFGMLKKRLAR